MWYIIQLLSILIQQTIHVQARVDASAAAGYAQPTGYDCRLRDVTAPDGRSYPQRGQQHSLSGSSTIRSCP